MCGGGGGSSAPIDTYQGPPGPGTGIAGVPIGVPNYQDAARSLLSVGQTYGQLAAQAADNVSRSMAPPPAPQSAFDSGIGQYIGQQAARPLGPSAPMQEIGVLESAYDPRTSATEMLEGYESALEPRPLSYYTPNAMEQMEEAKKEAEEQGPRFARGMSSRQRNGGGGDRGNTVGGGYDGGYAGGSALAGGIGIGGLY